MLHVVQRIGSARTLRVVLLLLYNTSVIGIHRTPRVPRAGDPRDGHLAEHLGSRSPATARSITRATICRKDSSRFDNEARHRLLQGTVHGFERSGFER